MVLHRFSGRFGETFVKDFRLRELLNRSSTTDARRVPRVHGLEAHATVYSPLRQLPILNAMRPIGFGPQSLVPILFVRLEISLMPYYLAVAFKRQYVRGDAI